MRPVQSHDSSGGSRPAAFFVVVAPYTFTSLRSAFPIDLFRTRFRFYLSEVLSTSSTWHWSLDRLLTGNNVPRHWPWSCLRSSWIRREMVDLLTPSRFAISSSERPSKTLARRRGKEAWARMAARASSHGVERCGGLGSSNSLYFKESVRVLKHLVPSVRQYPTASMTRGSNAIRDIVLSSPRCFG